MNEEEHKRRYFESMAENLLGQRPVRWCARCGGRGVISVAAQKPIDAPWPTRECPRCKGGLAEPRKVRAGSVILSEQ